MLKYLKMAIENCVGSPELWGKVRKQAMGFLVLFLNHTSDPLDDALLLARNLDPEKLVQFLLQGSKTRRRNSGGSASEIVAPIEPKKNEEETEKQSESQSKEDGGGGNEGESASESTRRRSVPVNLENFLQTSHGAVVIRRIVSFGWLFHEFVEGRLVDKLVTELEHVYGKLAEVRASIRVGEAANVRCLPDGRYVSAVSSPRLALEQAYSPTTSSQHNFVMENKRTK